MKLYRAPMVNCRRYFADGRHRRTILFVGRHGYRNERLATGFTVRLGNKVALVTLAMPGSAR